MSTCAAVAAHRLTVACSHNVETHHPAVVVGRGRVGKALLRMQPGAISLGRGDDLGLHLATSPPGSPVLVATTNDALPQVITSTPASRQPDLVFLQNGMLLPLLVQHGLADNTQALLYMSASADGSFTDGRQTVVCGRWADAVCGWLGNGGIACRSVQRGEYLALMVEKLLWASAFWLLSAGLGGLPVGAIAQQHQQAVAELAGELLPLAQRYLLSGGSRSSSGSEGSEGSAGGHAGLELEAGSLQEVEALTVDRTCQSMIAYSLSIAAAVPSRDMALAEFEWRNGWFLGQQHTPAHLRWLERAGVYV